MWESIVIRYRTTSRRSASDGLLVITDYGCVESNKPVADNDGNDGYFGEAWSSKPEGTRHLGSNNAHGSFGADMSPPIDQPTNDNESDMGSPKLENRKLPFRTLINEEKVESVDCVLPRAAVNVVKGRYDNYLMGIFVGKDLAFPVVQNYVINTWSKFGFQKLMRNDDGVYLFKFSSKYGME
ncbi:hypothetical protein Tco_1508068 [Tanacetum coccineum]